MQNIAMVGHIPNLSGHFWRPLNNSIPVGTTITETCNDHLLHFVVDHVHVDLGTDIRVMCLAPVDSTTTAKLVANGVLRRINQAPWREINSAWALNTTFDIMLATERALPAWAETRHSRT